MRLSPTCWSTKVTRFTAPSDAPSSNTDRVNHLYQDPHERNVKLFVHYGDLTGATNLISIIQQAQPNEICNLGAKSRARERDCGDLTNLYGFVDNFDLQSTYIQR